MGWPVPTWVAPPRLKPTSPPRSPTRLYFLPSRIRLARGDERGAAIDRAEGFRREPNDALSWAARGTGRSRGRTRLGGLQLGPENRCHARTCPSQQSHRVGRRRRIRHLRRTVSLTSRSHIDSVSRWLEREIFHHWSISCRDVPGVAVMSEELGWYGSIFLFHRRRRHSFSMRREGMFNLASGSRQTPSEPQYTITRHQLRNPSTACEISLYA